MRTTSAAASRSSLQSRLYAECFGWTARPASEAPGEHHRPGCQYVRPPGRLN
jgi:hypothetical protein